MSAFFDEDDNSESSQALGGAEDESQLREEVIEQESAPSEHTDASKLDVNDPAEPAEAGLPKSIGNER